MTEKNKTFEETLPTANCPGQIVIPTPKEKEALDAMRSIKERVRKIKKQLKVMESAGDDNDQGKIFELKKELSRLKSDWNEWEKKYQGHAKERMIALDHEEA